MPEPVYRVTDTKGRLIWRGFGANSAEALQHARTATNGYYTAKAAQAWTAARADLPPGQEARAKRPGTGQC